MAWSGLVACHRLPLQSLALLGRDPRAGTLAMSTTLRRRLKSQRPRQLLEAALEVFVDKGFAAARVDDVAAHAGVSKGTLYLYYPGKDALLKAVIAHYLGNAIAVGAEALGRHDGPAAEVLCNSMARWWRTIFDSPASAVFMLVVSEVRHFPEIAEFYVHEVVEPGQRLIGDLLRRGIERGEFRDVDVNETVYSLVLPMVMLCLHKHSLGACATGLPAVEPHAFIRHHFEFAVRALMPVPAGSSAAQVPPVQVH